MRKNIFDLTAQDILVKWKSGESIDWRPLTVKGKKEWLKACLLWSGLPEAPISKHNCVIDGNQVIDEVDFYCLLGEVFVGYRGYFGQDPHGFNDCFSEIYRHNPGKQVVEPGATVIINNESELCQVLNNIYKGYLSEIIRDFKKYGFQVILK